MKVNTEALLQQGIRLRDTMWKILEIREEVYRSSRVLATESVGEKFLPALQAARNQLKKQASDLDRLWHALKDISESYEACEERITERTETGSVWFQMVPAGWMTLTAPETQSPTLQWTPWE